MFKVGAKPNRRFGGSGSLPILVTELGTNFKKWINKNLKCILVFSSPFSLMSVLFKSDSLPIHQKCSNKIVRLNPVGSTLQV